MHFLSDPTLAVAAFEVLVGIALLSRAADAFVEGASEVAGLAKVSPVLVGAVIVGFGTSAPELLVSAIAAWNGDLDLGVGNIVGSNVANLSLVLGAAGLIIPLLVTRSVLVREAPLSLLSVLAFAYFTTGGLERWEGIVLLVMLAGALTWIVAGGMATPTPATLSAASDPAPVEAPDRSSPADDGESGALAPQLARTIVGLIGTVAGAQLLVWGARAIAVEVGLSGGFVGFTLVAIGTSLPELVTAVLAARRGATELLLGNLLGSNMFNSLAVGGVMAVVGPGVIADDGLRTIGVIVMVVVAVAAWVAMATLRRVYKIEATGLLICWFVAVVLLARTAGVEDALLP